MENILIDLQCTIEEFCNKAESFMSPAYILKPKLFRDGNHWTALLGDNTKTGVCGFGSSPTEAYEDFNKSWYEKMPQ